MTATTKASIQKRAQRINRLRYQIVAEEQRLSLEIWRYLAPRGSLRDLARQLEITPQYLCDISHQRRKISDSVLAKVVAL